MPDQRQSTQEMTMTLVDQPRVGSTGRGTERPTASPPVRRSVGMIGTYPPTECGIATFTANLRSAISSSAIGWQASVVRVVDELDTDRADPDVAGQWVTGDDRSLRRAAATLNRCDAVVLQHEYGLFGGPDGDDVLRLVEMLEVPLVAVLHTALAAPSDHQRLVLETIIASSAVVVVQSETARARIVAAHGSDAGGIVVIPHGAAANFDGPVPAGPHVPTVLTWGLLGPGKGIEHGIEAVARLWTRSPSLTYVVAGETHPKVRAASGETYRAGLQEQARRSGDGGRIRFDDGYRDWTSLRALVRTADVVLLPYDSRDQVSSGVLVEAVASGKPVVATRFPHAEELLSGGAGILVDHGDTAAMSDALDRVLHQPGLRVDMAAAARAAAQPLLWEAVGTSYRDLVESTLPSRAAA